MIERGAQAPLEPTVPVMGTWGGAYGKPSGAVPVLAVVIDRAERIARQVTFWLADRIA